MKEGLGNNGKTIIGKEANMSILVDRIRSNQLVKWLKKPKHLKDKSLRLATYILLFEVALVFLYPFLYIIVTSLKTNSDLYDLTVNWIPRSFKFQNYIIAFRALDYFKYFKNSFIYTVMSSIGHLLSCSFIGYGFARYEFPGKRFLFIMVIITIIVPIQTIIVPLYMIFANLNWLNTYLPVVVPTFFGFGLRGGLYVFIFRQFYLGLPKALEDAARIDGCNFFRTYWNIVLPVVKSAFLVTLVLSLVWHWNDYFEPLIYTNTSHLMPLPARLQPIVELVNKPPDELFSTIHFSSDTENVVNTAVLMAATFLILLPLLTAFAFLQRQFMQGIERTGMVE